MAADHIVRNFRVLLPKTIIVDDVEVAKEEAEFLMDAYKTAFSIIDFGDNQFGVMEKSRAFAAVAAYAQTIENLEKVGNFGSYH